jgi:hypothetical protein
MLKNVLRAGLVLGVCLELNAQPASETYTFCQEGFSEGAFVSGSFTGSDSNTDGQLVFDEVTDLTVNFSGNSTVGPLSFSFADFVGLVYDLDGGPLGDGTTGAVEGIAANSAAGSYSAGPGPESVCGVGSDCAVITDGTNTDNSQELISINGGSCGASNAAEPVPAMPLHLLLALSGLLALFGLRKLK